MGTLKKEVLLNLGIFINNEFLDNYVELVNANKNTKSEQFKTQKHHIIPAYYYRYNNLDIDNSVENVVNLVYKDHLLAHYYLALCSSNDKYRYANECAIVHIVGVESFDEKEFYKSLPEYQRLYEHSRLQTSLKMKGSSPPNKGKRCINKDGKNLYVLEQGIDRYIEKGYHLGKAPLNDLAMIHYKLMGENNKGKSHPMGKWVTNGSQNKRVFNIDYWLQKGWTLGKTEKQNNKNKATNIGTIVVHKDKKDLRINAKELDLYLSEGWQKGSFVKGRICINNSTENKYIEKGELEKWLDMGWKLGQKKQK